jgi:type I restriction enzyme S subunit
VAKQSPSYHFAPGDTVSAAGKHSQPYPWEQVEFGHKIYRRTKSEMSSNKLPGVEYEDINSGQGTLNKDITKKSIRKRGIFFQPFDVLFGKLRPYLKNWLYPNFKGVAVGDFWVLYSKLLEPSFIYGMIQTQKFQNVANLSSGSKMPRSDWKLVSRTLFRFPMNKNEQRKIGLLLLNLDKTITLHEEKHRQLERLKKALLQKMFADKTGYLALRFKGFTEKWEQEKLGNIIRQSSLKNNNYNYPILTSAHEGLVPQSTHFGSQQRHDTSDYNVIKPNQITYRNRSDDGRFTFNINKLNITGLVSKFYPVFSFENTDNDFMVNNLNHNPQIKYDLDVLSVGTGQHVLSFTNLKKYEILAPSYVEQKRIGQFLLQLNRTITLHDKKIQYLKQLKRGLLQKMFV